LRVNSKGIWKSRYQLTDESFFKIPLIVPSDHERKQIAQYLDWKTSQINRFIKAKRRQIELLKEQKQVIINDAVTGKIDVRTGRPYPRYKDSGSEWVEKIPEEWSIISLKRVTQFNPSKKETKLCTGSSDHVVFLPMEKVSNDGIVDCSLKLPYWKLSNGFSYFQRGDVVIAKITPCFENGKGAYLNCLETEFGFGTTEFITIRPGKRIAGGYLRLLLSSKWFLSIGEGHMTGSAGQKRISVEFIKNFVVGLPTTDNQNLILKLVAEKVSTINDRIGKIQREIQLFQEYISRLIADVVTGKVDVRHIKVSDLEIENENDGIEDITEVVEEMEEGIVAD
jgi:type I restriction enzyme S subunit